MSLSRIILWDKGMHVLEARRLPTYRNYKLVASSGRRVSLVHPVSDQDNSIANLSSEEQEDLYDIVVLDRKRERDRVQKRSRYQGSVQAMSATLAKIYGVAHPDGHWSEDDETLFGDDDAPSESLPREGPGTPKDSAVPTDAAKTAWSFEGMKHAIDMAGTDVLSKKVLRLTTKVASFSGIAQNTHGNDNVDQLAEVPKPMSQPAEATSTGMEQPSFEGEPKVIASARSEKHPSILPGGGISSSFVVNTTTSNEDYIGEPTQARFDEDDDTGPQPDVVVPLEKYGIQAPNELLEDFPGRRVQFGSEVKIRKYVKENVPDARHANRASGVSSNTPSVPFQPSRPVLRIRPSHSSPPLNHNAAWSNECEEDLNVLENTLPVVGATNDPLSIGYTRNAIRDARIAILDARNPGPDNPDAVAIALRVTDEAHKFHEETLRRVNWKSNQAHFEEFQRAVANCEEFTYHAHAKEVSKQPADYYEDLQK